jgi:hypothetical protein
MLPLVAATTVLVGAGVALEPQPVANVDGARTVLAAQPWLEALSRTYLRTSVDEVVRSLSDPTLVGDRYWTLLRVAFSGYYTHFAWGNLALHPAWALSLALLSLVALGGLVIGGARMGAELPLWQRRCFWVFLMSVAVAWISLFLRLHPLPSLDQPVYIPRARYMFWAIVPTLWLLVLGLSWATPMRWRRLVLAGVVVLFVCLNLAAWLWTITSYFYL